VSETSGETWEWLAPDETARLAMTYVTGERVVRVTASGECVGFERLPLGSVTVELPLAELMDAYWALRQAAWNGGD
jgi:hypothetical protein